MKSTNCVVDSRWTCKLSDFGPRTIYKSLIEETGSWRTEAGIVYCVLFSHNIIYRFLIIKQIFVNFIHCYDKVS